MDANTVVEEESWFEANMWLILINLILGVVVIILIWICNTEPEKKKNRKGEKVEKSEAKELVESPAVEVETHAEKKVPVEEVLEDETVETVVEDCDQGFVDKMDSAEDEKTTVEGSEVKLVESVTYESHTDADTLVEVEAPIEKKDVEPEIKMTEDVTDESHIDTTATVQVEASTEKLDVEPEIKMTEDVTDESHIDTTATVQVEASTEKLVEKDDTADDATQSTPTVSDVQLSENDYVVVKKASESETTENTAEKAEDEMTSYNIIVKTGDVAGAGTDANVFITLFGDKGDTGKIDLETSKTHNSKFERDNLDTFAVEAKDIGTVEKIIIGHDNKGGFAGWYLNHVTVNNPASNYTLTFPAKRWLDKKEDDGKLEVELYPLKEDSEKVCGEAVEGSLTETNASNNEITVTSNLMKDDDSIKDSLIGKSEGLSEKVCTEVAKDDFSERIACDENIPVSCESVEDDMEVKESDAVEAHNEALDDHFKDGEISVVMDHTDDILSKNEIAVTSPDVEPVVEATLPQMITYNIDVKTGDVSGAGTDAHVFVIVYGEKGDTGKIELEASTTHKEKFERKHLDSFKVEALDVGAIEKLRIGHDNKGGFAGWYLDNVTVSSPSQKKSFVADRWLDKKEGDGKLEIDLYPFQDQEEIPLQVLENEEEFTVDTATSLEDANENFLMQLDSKEDDGKVQTVAVINDANHRSKDGLEASTEIDDDKHASKDGCEGSHSIKMYRETIVKKVIQVQMLECPVDENSNDEDNTDKVTESADGLHPRDDDIKSQDHNAEHFPEEDLVQEEISVDVQNEPDIDFSPVINKNEGFEDEIEPNTEEVQEEVRVDVQNETVIGFSSLINKGEDNDAENKPGAEEDENEGKSYASSEEDEEKVDVELAEDVIAGTRLYKIDVKTGDKKYAGTDANVFIILYGKNIDTGKLMLEKSSTHKDPFERKHVDTFTMEAPNVGNLEKIRIGHDNKGGLAGWYIDDVVVSVLESGGSWCFPVNRWLDKHKDDGKLEVDCLPSS